MAQITSREELEEWLKEKPADWGQVIAARAALRVLPYAFGERTRQRWFNSFALSLTRATVMSWAARNVPADTMVAAAEAAIADTYGATSAASSAAVVADAAEAIRCAAIAAADAAQPVSDFVVDAIESAADAVADAAYGDDADAYTARAAAVWKNTSHDCNWLESDLDRAFGAGRLTYTLLWPTSKPRGWDEAHNFAMKRLIAQTQRYSVWIDWYNRRIEGHDAAFDIPGDIDRTHDKAILARLADATDADFWGKGATFVNTTLQRWIDEAREQAAIDYAASGAPLNLGSEAELAARPELLARFAEVEAELAKLKDQRASLADSGHGQIGHNLPKGAGSLRDEEIALLNQRVAELEAIVPAIGAVLAKLETVVPAAAAVPTLAVEAVAELVVSVPELNLWQRAIQPLEDRTSPEVRKGFESAVGASLLSIPYIAYVTLPEAIRAFLHYFYTVWFPILPG